MLKVEQLKMLKENADFMVSGIKSRFNQLKQKILNSSSCEEDIKKQLEAAEIEARKWEEVIVDLTAEIDSKLIDRQD